MARGTSAGLLDQQRSQSVFKHKILNTYVLPFATMTGKWSPGHRVVVVDGFAGRGRYPDGTPASGELILQAAERATTAVIDAILVEKNSSDFKHLQSVVAEYSARNVVAVAHAGLIQQHLPAVVTQATGVPLFLFLDPCGAGIPFADITSLLAGPREDRRPATEVLLNFNADLTRRAAGALNKGLLDHDILPVMDRTCGGPWWRQVALDAYKASSGSDFEGSAHAVVAAYAQKIGAAARMHAVTVPVYRQLKQQPVYHLVFLTRGTEGVWVFADAVARARQEWLTILGYGPQEDTDDGGLFPISDLGPTDQISAEQDAARHRVEQNLRRLCTPGHSIRLVEHPWEVFGSDFGVATESTVRKVLRGLESTGVIHIQSAKHLRNWIVTGLPAGSAVSL